MAALMPSVIPTLPGRPGHRRSYTTTGPGAFVSLGALPRRRQQQEKKTVFSLTGNDDDEDSHDDSHEDDDVLNNVPPVLRLNPNNSLRLSVSTSTEDDALLPMRTSPTKANIPFPRSSAPASPTELTHSAPLSRPGMTRTTSTPIILSTGKPLKSSLKSSSSSPHISFPPQQQQQQQQSPGHLRARSAPSTPHLEQLPSPVPKNVHFPTNEEGGLATVRVFNRSARPASLLTKPNGEDTETETEGELSTGSSGIIRGFSAVSQPFPRSPLGGHHHHHHHHERLARYEIDSGESSSVPMKNPPPYGNVYLESISYTPRSSLGTPQGLSGTLLVRNIAYEKTVAVRFTLDDWQTTSEVSARHVTSLHTLPPVFPQSMTYGDVAQAISSTSTPTDVAIPQWDRFGFTIKLEDYAANLSKRTMFLVVRYTANAVTGPVESWDNNMGQNYKIVYKEVPVTPTPSSTTTTSAPIPQRARGFTVSSPPSFGPVMTPTTAMSSNSPSSFREPQHAQMVAQTTLLRLKKLNLRNYAAPSNPTTNASATGTTGPSSSVTVPAPASSPGPSSTSGVAVDTSTDDAGVEGASGAGSSVYSVGAKEAISAQGAGVLQKDIQGRERMQVVLPTHVGVGSTSVSSAVLETGVTVDTREGEDGSSSDEESLKTPTAGGMKSRSGSLTGLIQEFQFPTSPVSSSPTKARIISDPIPILTFSSSSSPSSSSSSGSPELTTPNLNGLMPIDINHRRNSNRPGVLSPLPLEMGTSPPFSTLPEYTLTAAAKRMNGHGHSLSHPSARPNSTTTTTTPSITTQIDHNNKENSNDTTGGAAVYFPWGLSGGSQTPKSPEEVKKMLEGIREKSTSSPVRRSPTNSGTTSPVKRGGSLSPVRVSETMDDGKEEENEEVVSPQPRKDWSKVGSGGWNSNSNLGVSRAAGIGHPRASPIMMNTSTTKTPSPSTPTLNNVNVNANAKGSNSSSDSIYQAVVRQWCFAQGPSPVSLGPASTAHSSSQSTQGQQAQARYRNGRGGGGDGAGLVV